MDSVETEKTMGFWRRLIRLATAVINEKGCEYEAGGKQVSCRQCGDTMFFKSKAQLNTKDMTLWGLDCFDRSAQTLRCRTCGYMYWFGKSVINRTWST